MQGIRTHVRHLHPLKRAQTKASPLAVKKTISRLAPCTNQSQCGAGSVDTAPHEARAPGVGVAVGLDAPVITERAQCVAMVIMVRYFPATLARLKADGIGADVASGKISPSTLLDRQAKSWKIDGIAGERRDEPAAIVGDVTFRSDFGMTVIILPSGVYKQATERLEHNDYFDADISH